MKNVLSALLALLAAATAFAAETTPAPKVDEKLDRMIREVLPLCSMEATATITELPAKLPSGLTGNVVKIESKRPNCEGQYVAVTSREGGFFLGYPWFLQDEKGTIEEKLTAVMWRAMQQNVTPVIDRTKTSNGLYKVTLLQTTEPGKVPLDGYVDPNGTVFFMGSFRSLKEDLRSSRLKTFEPLLANAPATGAAKPSVTIVEFSDFECPACQRASAYLNPILEKHSDRVRYIRYDLPLVNNHPWAFSAAMAGRAVHRQKPELFWKFKKHVYENQEKLSAFTFDEFARGFAEDNGIDLAKYDADLQSETLRNEILKGIGVAFSNDVRATPSFLVNGQFVDAGDGGKALEAYVETLLKK